MGSIDDTIPIIWVNLAFITNYRETYNYCTKKLKWTDFKLLSPYINNVTVEWLCFKASTGLQQLLLASHCVVWNVKETVHTNIIIFLSTTASASKNPSFDSNINPTFTNNAVMFQLLSWSGEVKHWSVIFKNSGI